MTDISVWAYPWDLHDIGPDQATARLLDAGCTMVSLATAYHAGRFLQPGNPRRRVYFPQDGTLYYRPDPARWQGAEIQPLMAEIVATEGCMLAEMLRRRFDIACARLGLDQRRWPLRSDLFRVPTAQMQLF